MGETLSSGPERPYRGRPRWLGPAAGVAAALLLAWLAVRAGGTPDPEPPVAVATTTPAPPPPSPTPPPPEPVFRLDGEPGAGPDVRLLVGGPPGVLDARTGRLTPLAGLPGGRTAHVLLNRGPGFTTALVYDGTERFGRGVLLPDRGRPVDLGRLVDLLPRRDGTVLTVVCLPGSAGGCVLRNRTATGAVRWQRQVPDALGLIRDTPYGVLLAGGGGDRGADLRLEDPRTGRVHRTIARSSHVLTADDRRVVYQRAGCDYGCPLVVAELADGRQAALPVRPGRPAAAALSPDGRRLALGYQGLHQQDPAPSPLREGRAVLVDLVTGHEQPVPGLATGAKAVPVPLWTPDSSRLLLAVSDGAGTGRLAAWRPGAGRLTVLPVRAPGFAAAPGLVALLT